MAALIPCPGCGGEISLRAKACPHCGMDNSSSLLRQFFDAMSYPISATVGLVVLFIALVVWIVSVFD